MKRERDGKEKLPREYLESKMVLQIYSPFVCKPHWGNQKENYKIEKKKDLNRQIDLKKLIDR